MTNATIELRGHPSDAINLEGFMIFPSSADQRREYWQELDVQRIEHIARNDPTAPVTMIAFDLIRALRHNARAKVRREAHARYRKGVVAGKLVAYIHALNTTDVKQYVGLNSAVEIIRIEEMGARSSAAALHRDRQQRSMHSVARRAMEPFGTSQVMAIWSEYRSVAHLWAAYLYQTPRHRPPSMLPTEAIEMERMCGVASQYLEFGASFEYERVHRGQPDERRLLNRADSVVVKRRSDVDQPTTTVPLRAPDAEQQRLLRLLPRKKSRNA